MKTGQDTTVTDKSPPAEQTLALLFRECRNAGKRLLVTPAEILILAKQKGAVCVDETGENQNESEVSILDEGGNPGGPLKFFCATPRGAGLFST